MAQSTSLVLNVTRRAPELITPARPTPHEFKEVSDLDNLEVCRHHTSVIQFYRGNNELSKDPATVIKDAVAKALVWYYPLAGRLREVKGRNELIVECNEEGMLFIEAEAGVCLDHFGDELLLPPFPCLEELLFDVPAYSGVLLDSPLILIQVTRLRCGGFIFAIRINHVIIDGQGTIEFMNAIAELARGAHSPSIKPVWERHLLTARNMPRVTCEPPPKADTKASFFPHSDMLHKTFFFGPMEIAAMRRFIPQHLRASRITTFEILIACIWRCRVIAIQPDPEETVQLKCIINARTRCNPPLPNGYYGNAITYAIALPTARELTSNHVGYALELIKKAKAEVAQSYNKSIAKVIAMNAMLHLTTIWSLVVSDVTRIGFDNVDYGWGPPCYGGPARVGVGVRPGGVTHCVSVKNRIGEKGIAIPICLRKNEMEIFVNELNKLLGHLPEDPNSSVGSSTVISSAL